MVYVDSVARCRIKSKIFFLGMDIDIMAKFEIIRKDQCTYVNELCSNISQVNLNTDRENPLYQQRRENISNEDMEVWVDVENNDRVMEAQIEGNLQLELAEARLYDSKR